MNEKLNNHHEGHEKTRKKLKANNAYVSLRVFCVFRG